MGRPVGREKEREGEKEQGRGGGLITARGTWLLQTILTHGLATRIAPHPIGQAAKKETGTTTATIATRTAAAIAT